MNMLARPVGIRAAASVTRTSGAALRPWTAAICKPQSLRNGLVWARNMSSEAFVHYKPSLARVGQPAPKFSAPAVIDGEITSVDLDASIKKGYTVLLFYPKDFTYVCPTEIIAFSDRAAEFEALGAQVMAISTDTEECHLAWVKTPRHLGGLGEMNIPLVADTKKEISAKYGVLVEAAGIALRGLFIIDNEGTLQQITVNNFPVGRDVDEALRLIQAFQFVAEHGEVCPANWKPGEATMHGDPNKSMEFFQAQYSEASAAESTTSKLRTVTTEAEFNDVVKGSGEPNVTNRVVAMFTAPWCGKCRQITPFMEEQAAQNPNLHFIKIDSDAPQTQELKEKYDVESLPAFRLFDKGNVLEDAMITGYRKAPLREAITRLSGLSSVNIAG